MFVTDNYEFVPGTYVMLIDPLDQLGPIHIRFSYPKALQISKLVSKDNQQVFMRCMMKLAQTSKLPHSYYLRRSDDYGDSISRLITFAETKCWYGFIYTKSQAKFSL